MGLSGYAIATLTGYYRIVNNRHWLSDVIGGAGIGILSTKLAYWIHPFLKKKIFKRKENTNGMLMPFYDGKAYGLNATISF
ncbi:phosphatase PAP2 family protein [Maribacter ulvicola]|uniref:phosphatase PAP2 family protein n=1 Tax=Maribacter ulvicola TaxID=228959 RepID=UPI0021D19E3F|nr:phosphatase PAP2 family protein [Maribacter ulvicola]